MIMASHLEAASTIHYAHSEVCLQCPRCDGWIGHLPDTNIADNSLLCSNCYFKLENEHGIWRALLPDRAAHLSPAMKADQCVPSTEGRGSAEYYLALPYRDLSGGNSEQWAIHSRTFRYIKRSILPEIAPKHDSHLRILDLGAGNGWLSYRLALAGHAPIAVDLLTNYCDGLGAAVHYKKHLTTLFPRFQADIDSLPFVDDQFDLVIYHGSFHYSENYERTLAEALRCTRSEGTILIADTPWYSNESGAQQMLSDHREAHVRRPGLPVDDINSLKYLTDKRLQHMEASFGIHWQVHTTDLGVYRLMRPLLAKLHGTHEPAELRIYSAKAIK
jgi:SAM-dependent methyltransferase